MKKSDQVVRFSAYDDVNYYGVSGESTKTQIYRTDGTENSFYVPESEKE